MKRERIDVHSHIYTIEHLKTIERFGALAGWKLMNNAGVRMLYGERGYPFVITQSCYDMEERVKELDKAGVTRQILSPSEPFFDFLEDTKESVKLARSVNDEVSKISETNRDRFAGLAGLPLNDVGASVDEARRACKDLGLKGVILPTKVQGNREITSEEFSELFRALDMLGATIFIHPTLPSGAEQYRKYFLGMMVLYPYESGLTIAKMIFSGMLDKYTKIKIMVADLGGALPMLSGRMFRFYSSIPECKADLKKEPSEYLKDRIFYENGSEFYRYSMRCCYEMVGASHILFGTNHPSPIVAFQDAIDSVESFDISTEEKDMILHQNARKLFSLA